MKKIIVLTLILFSTSFFGQPGSIDLSFNSLDTGFNNAIEADGRVITSIIQSDGKIIIGGDFTSYNGTSINKIARLNTEGTLDTSFTPGTVNGTIQIYSRYIIAGCSNVFSVKI